MRDRKSPKKVVRLFKPRQSFVNNDFFFEPIKSKRNHNQMSTDIEEISGKKKGSCSKHIQWILELLSEFPICTAQETQPDTQ